MWVIGWDKLGKGGRTWVMMASTVRGVASHILLFTMSPMRYGLLSLARQMGVACTAPLAASS